MCVNRTVVVDFPHLWAGQFSKQENSGYVWFVVFHRGPCSDAPLSSRLMSPPTDTSSPPRAPRSSLWSLGHQQGQFGLEEVTQCIGTWRGLVQSPELILRLLL